MQRPIISLLFVGGVLAGCSDSGASYTPILDGAPSPAFQSDLSACQTLARDQRQMDQETRFKPADSLYQELLYVTLC